MAKEEKKKPQTAVAARPKDEALEAVPDYIKQGSNRGNENVTSADVVLPRLSLLQQISPECVRGDEKYMKDAEPGMYSLSIPHRLLGKEVTIVPVHYEHQYVIFRERKKGGGFRGAYPTEQEAIKAKQGYDDAKDLEITETGLHYLLVILDDGPVEAVLSFKKTGLKTSRELNSLVRLRGADRFAGRYVLGSFQTSNDQGTFIAFTIKAAGWATKKEYATGEKTYQSIMAGSKKVDWNGEQVGVKPEEKDTDEY